MGGCRGVGAGGGSKLSAAAAAAGWPANKKMLLAPHFLGRVDRARALCGAVTTMPGPLSKQLLRCLRPFVENEQFRSVNGRAVPVVLVGVMGLLVSYLPGHCHVFIVPTASHCL